MTDKIVVVTDPHNIHIITAGEAGPRGYSGYSGASGIGTSGASGYSGYSGADGSPGGASGLSGYSGYSGQDASVSGTSGYSGYSGFSGYSGSDGIIGTNGASGFSGYSGADGASGYSGYSGVNGASGYSGYSGSGYSGYSGYSGESGYSGFSGLDGTASASGFSGYSGYSGADGASGYSGYSGADGASGYSGYSGDTGTSGYSGFSGIGTSGFSGYSGVGTSGFSGYSGIGTSGFSGYSGVGTSGYSGYSGADGATGTSGYSGYSGIGTSGYSGYSGTNGAAGTSGFSGFSGYSGYLAGAETWTGDKTLAENVGIVLDAALSADGKYSGIVEAGTSAAALAFGEVCYRVTATGKWDLASAAAAGVGAVISTGELGMCVLAAGGADAATTMLKYGKCRADALFDTFTVGAPVYLSAATPGKTVSAAPTGTTDFTVRKLGHAEDANTVFFSPSDDYVTLETASLKTVNGISFPSSGFTLGTPVAATSGTAIDFTGIPAGTTRIVINFSAVSTSGTSRKCVQIGDSGGVENTGYTGCAIRFSAASVDSLEQSSAAFQIDSVAAADVLYGSLTLTLENASTFTWSCTGVVSLRFGTASVCLTAVTKSLSAELTTVRVTTVGGSDTFDSGEVNIAYM